jgi:primosomal protein N'
MSELFADVAVHAQLFSNATSIYTYHVPQALRSTITEGALVWVPFGRQRVQGIVLALYTSLPPHIKPTPEQAQHNRDNIDPDAPTIRPIAELSEGEIVIPSHLGCFGAFATAGCGSRINVGVARYTTRYGC